MACQAYVIRNNDSLEELQEIMEDKKKKKRKSFAEWVVTSNNIYQYETEQLHSNDKNFIVTNKSILALLQSQMLLLWIFPCPLHKTAPDRVH